MGDDLARALEQEDVRSRGTSDGVLLPGSLRWACVRVLVAESLFNHSSNNGRRRRFQSDISICSWAGDVLILGPRRHTYLNVSLGRVYMFVQRTIGSYILKKECSIVMEYADADVVGVVVEAQLCVNGGTALLCGTFTHLVAPPRHLHPSAHHAHIARPPTRSTAVCKPKTSRTSCRRCSATIRNSACSPAPVTCWPAPWGSPRRPRSRCVPCSFGVDGEG